MHSQGVFSSREIEKRCHENLGFMFILHFNCPNFRVLSDFRKDNYGFFKDCFKQSVLLAMEAGMASLGHVSLGGSKFKANTSKHKAMSYGRLKAKEKGLTDEIEALIAKADKCDEEKDEEYQDNIGYEIPEELRIKEKRLAKIKEAKEALEKREHELNPCKEIYKSRKKIVEPVFGQIKNSGFRAFSLRGYEKAKGGFSLICTVHNIRKVVKAILYGQVCLEARGLASMAA